MKSPTTPSVKPAGYTPGNWAVVPAPAQASFAIVSDGHGSIALVNTRTECEANANVLAAAPAMLLACNGLNGLTIARCEQCDGTGQRNNTSDACAFCGGVGEVVQGFFHPDELRAIRAAINKAKGGAQ